MVKTLRKRGSSVKSMRFGGVCHQRDGKLSSGLHDLETARRHYGAMRDLIIRHRGGSLDERVLGKLLDLSRKAAAAVDDGNCRSLLSAGGGYRGPGTEEGRGGEEGRCRGGADHLKKKDIDLAPVQARGGDHQSQHALRARGYEVRHGGTSAVDAGATSNFGVGVYRLVAHGHRCSAAR